MTTAQPPDQPKCIPEYMRNMGYGENTWVNMVGMRWSPRDGATGQKSTCDHRITTRSTQVHPRIYEKHGLWREYMGQHGRNAVITTRRCYRTEIHMWPPHNYQISPSVLPDSIHSHNFINSEMAKSTSTLSQLNAQMSWSVIFNVVKFGQDLQITFISWFLWQLNFWHLKKKWHSSSTSPTGQYAFITDPIGSGNTFISTSFNKEFMSRYAKFSNSSSIFEMRKYLEIFLQTSIGLKGHVCT